MDKKGSSYRIAAAIALVLLGGIALAVGIGIGKGIAEEGQNDLGRVVGGKPEPVICDAEEIAEREIDYTPCVSLGDLSADSDLVREWRETLSTWSSQDANLMLYGQEGCYLSVNPLYMFDCRSRELGSTVCCYLFTENGEEAGAIMLNGRNGKVLSEVTLNGINGNTRSDILAFLAKDPDKKYIVLTDEYSHMFLDCDNRIVSATYTQDGEYGVVGDYYGSLNSRLLEISYNMIADKGNWLWIQF